MGSGVSVSHGRWGIKFRLRHSGVVVSWKGAAVLFDPRVRQSSTPECVCLLRLPPSSSPWGSGQLKGSCRFVRPQSVSVFFGWLRLRCSDVVVSWKGAVALFRPQSSRLLTRFKITQSFLRPSLKYWTTQEPRFVRTTTDWNHLSHLSDFTLLLKAPTLEHFRRRIATHSTIWFARARTPVPSHLYLTLGPATYHFKIKTLLSHQRN